jgi:hypothetical protein
VLAAFTPLRAVNRRPSGWPRFLELVPKVPYKIKAGFAGCPWERARPRFTALRASDGVGHQLNGAQERRWG